MAVIHSEIEGFQDFLKACCALAAGLQIPKGALWTAYLKYAQQKGYRRTLNRREWPEALRDVGCADDRVTNGNHVWRGITLRQTRVTPVTQVSAMSEVTRTDERLTSAEDSARILPFPSPSDWNPPNLAALEEAIQPPPLDAYKHYAVDAVVQEILQVAVRRTKREGAVNVLLVGKPSTGKSSLPAWLAAITQRPFFSIDCSAVRDVSDWWGFRDAPDGRTVFFPSPLYHLLRKGGGILLFDEINRLPPNLLNPLLGIFDDRRRTYIPWTHEHLMVGPATLLFATANLDGGLAGTFKENEALFDRMASTIRLKELPPDVQITVVANQTGCSREVAKKLVEIAAKINALMKNPGGGGGISHEISLRAMKEAASSVVGGLSLWRACRVAYVDQYSDDGGSASERFRVEQIVLGVLGPDPLR